MPRQTSSRLIRSNSYFNLLRPYLNERCLSTYATCPPINMHQKRLQQNDRLSSLRAFDFGSVSQSQVSTSSSRKTITQYNWQRSSTTSSNASEKADKKFKSTACAENAVSKQMDKYQDNMPQCYNATIMQRSLPVFEVLPPLCANRNQHLVYENSYFLDGLNYDTAQDQATKHLDCGKLKLDYLRFIKSINNKGKPSDYDIIFGNAKVLLASSCGWERSRIDWLLKLERKRDTQQKHKHFILLEDYPEIGNGCCFPINTKMLPWNPKTESTV